MTLIGIDLGTTNSAIAYLKDGKPVIIENDRGERTTPSVFQINHVGEIQVGTLAKNGYPTYPKETVQEAKRKMGTNELIKVSGKEYRSEEISAHILMYLKMSAEKFLGKPVTEAVITVPAYFTDAQRKATQKAGEIAGLKVERIINEPTAAAVAYGFDNMDKDQHILVYDLGGGTFDVSVVELFSGVVEVKASSGNNKLGGMDFDNALVEWLLKKRKEETGIDLLSFGTEEEIQQKHARLKTEAENVKKALSTQQTAKFNLPFLAIHNNLPITIDDEITRTQFENLIKELVESTLIQVNKALEDANLTIDQVDEFLLVGGSTRIPFVQELVEKKFGKTLRKDINPDEAVALGAAIQAGIKSGEIDSAKGLMVIDLCPYSLGVDVVKNIGGQLVPGFFDEIIERNSTIPITRSNIYNTAEDYQEEVSIGVYQKGSDDSQYVRPELRISSEDIVISGIPSRLAGEEKIQVEFTFDINGNIFIEAIILSTGKKISKIVNIHQGIMSDEAVNIARQELEQEWNKSEMYEEVKNVINRAEKVKEEVSLTERLKIEELLLQLKSALSKNNVNLIKQYEDELTDILIELV